MTDSVVIPAFECPSKCSNSYTVSVKIRLYASAAYPLGCTAIGKPHLAASSHQLILPGSSRENKCRPHPEGPLPCLLPAWRLATASGKRQSKNVMAVIPLTSTATSFPRHPITPAPPPVVPAEAGTHVT